jgi:hypothetical protein
LFITANAATKNFKVDLNSSAHVELRCVRQDLLGTFPPFKPNKTAERDVVRPDLESFLLAIKICQDERLPLGGSDASVLQAQPAQWFLP